MIKKQGNNSLNILFVNYYGSQSGGVSYSTRLLIESLLEKGNNVVLVSKEEYSGIKTYVMKDVRKIPLFFLRDLYLKYFLSKIIKKDKIDIIHCADGRFSVAATVGAAKSNNIPSVLHFRDFWFNCLKGSLLNEQNKICPGLGVERCIKCTKHLLLPWELYKYRYFKKRIKTIDKASARIAVSESVRENLIISGVNEKIDIVSNPVKIDREYGEIRKNKKIEELKLEGKVIVTYIGNLYFHKGIKNIMKVASELSKRNSNIFFLIVGEGYMAKYCRKYINKNNLRNVILTGKIDHSSISLVYEKSDIMFLPSIWLETFSRSVIESMSFKKPVITSKLGGNIEIIQDGINGYLVDPHNTRECVEKILSLVSNPKLRNDIGNNAFVRVKDFDVDIVSSKVLSIYKRFV